MSSIEENKKKSSKSKFPKLYKFLKETYLLSDDTHSFIELTQIFSIPIFYQILFMFTIIKTLLIGGYFIFNLNELSNWTTTLILLEITTSFLLTQQQAFVGIKTKGFDKFIDSTFLEKILKLTYIIIFCLEQNITIYYYDCLMFNLNPGYIFFIVLLIYFFDMKSTRKFNEYLFYSYIFNLVFFIYFCSFRNFMNFFLPTNLVLSMFIMMNLISQNYHKKLMKMMIHHKFFENLVHRIFRLNKNEMSVVFDEKVLYKEVGDQDEEKLSKRNCEIFESIDSRTQDEMNRIAIDDFKGFELVYKNKKSDAENKFHFFMNFLFYLRNNNLVYDPLDNSSSNAYLTEIEKIFVKSKSLIKNLKFKNFFDSLEKSSFGLREKIVNIIIRLAIEAGCDRFKISSEDLILNVSYDTLLDDTYHIILGNDENLKKCSDFTIDIISDLSNSLKFSLNILESTNSKKLEIKFIRGENIKKLNDDKKFL